MALDSTILKGQKVYFFKDRFFEHEGRKFEIVATESTGRGVLDCVHTIKAESGATKEVKMRDLLKKLLAEKNI